MCIDSLVTELLFCQGEKDNELTTLSVQRRVFISRDEQRQVNQSFLTKQVAKVLTSLSIINRIFMYS